MTQMLSFSDLTGGYGEMRVLHGVGGAFEQGSITAILGANGAGKTTLLRLLSGQIFPTGGDIVFEKQSIVNEPAHSRVNAGLVMVPEGRMIFPLMTVEENLRVGASVPHARAAARETLAQVFELFPQLLERRNQLGGTLSGGEQQMLAIGRGVMSGPRMMLLDEPTLGLAPVMCKLVFEFVDTLRQRGFTIVIAEQDVAKTLAIADRAIVIANGSIVVEGDAQAVAADEKLRHNITG